MMLFCWPGNVRELQHVIERAVTMSAISIRGEEMKIFSLKNIQSVINETENEAWKKLMHILTHEIMNSITPILSLAETFSGQTGHTTDPEIMNQAMQVIRRRSKGLVQFVDNYRQLTRIPAPQKEWSRLDEMIGDLANLFRAQQIRFTYTINPNELSLCADRGQMEQVLINLIINAWEACSHLPEPKVHVRIKEGDYRSVQIEVSDNGSDILPNVLERIFIPFFTTKKSGSGIGLNICRQIIDAHGGTIQVVSHEGEGTTFSIQINA